MLKNLQMQNKELQAETKADSEQIPIVASPAQMPQNPMLAAVSWNMLLKLFVLKFVCNHTWSVHFKMNVYDYTGKSIVRVEQTLICQNCGKFKKLKL